MYSEQIAEYFASVKFKPDSQSFRKMEQWLRVVEKKIERTANRINKQDLMGGLFKVDNAKLASSLNKSLAQASNRVTFNIKNFKIDEGALNRTLQNAALRARSITINPRVGNVSGGGGNVSNRTTGGSSGGRGVRSLGVGWHSALAGGGILSGFGLRALNERLQQFEMQPVMMQSVTGGNQQKANEQLMFLRSLAGEVGTTSTNLTPMYTKFFASAQGTPLEKFAQSGFRSMTRYGAVMGLDQEEMKGSLKALQQIVNKQRLYSEELSGQLTC
jgi:phage tail tape-measure protein